MSTRTKEQIETEIFRLVEEHYQVAHQRKPFVPGTTKVSCAGRVYGSEEMKSGVESVLQYWLTAWPDAFEAQSASEAFYGEAARLSLDHTKAVRELGRKPVWDFRKTVEQTAAWYRLRHEAGAGHDKMHDFTRQQIADYTCDAEQNSVAWAN